MGTDYFEFWNLSGAGDEIGTPQKVATDTGVILQCHTKCDPVEIRHLCAVARKTHNYPVDIALWSDSDTQSVLIWSARIYWRSANYVNDTRIVI